MHMPVSNSDQASLPRERCGVCSCFNASPVHAGFGVCPWTVGTPHEGALKAAAQCVVPKRFTPKETRRYG